MSCQVSKAVSHEVLKAVKLVVDGEEVNVLEAISRFSTLVL